jgi:hypothetical protein
MLTIGGSISWNGFNVPSIVSVYDRPSRVSLSWQTMYVSSEAELGHRRGDCVYYAVKDLFLENTYFDKPEVVALTKHPSEFKPI